MPFRKITDAMFVSAQIGIDTVAEAKAKGIALIVNNRPEGESDDQPAGSAIEAAAHAARIGYLAIPVTHAGFSQAQVKAMADAIDAADGPVLAFCRSGSRSALLWALAAASKGEDPDRIAAQAAGAGYDIAPVRPIVDVLATGSQD